MDKVELSEQLSAITAIQSISTNTSLGRRETWTQARGSDRFLKISSINRIHSRKSFISARNTVVFTTFCVVSSQLPQQLPLYLQLPVLFVSATSSSPTISLLGSRDLTGNKTS